MLIFGCRRDWALMISIDLDLHTFSFLLLLFICCLRCMVLHPEPSLTCFLVLSSLFPQFIHLPFSFSSLPLMAESDLPYNPFPRSELLSQMYAKFHSFFSSRFLAPMPGFSKILCCKGLCSVCQTQLHRGLKQISDCWLLWENQSPILLEACHFIFYWFSFYLLIYF